MNEPNSEQIKIIEYLTQWRLKNKNSKDIKEMIKVFKEQGIEDIVTDLLQRLANKEIPRDEDYFAMSICILFGLAQSSYSEKSSMN